MEAFGYDVRYYSTPVIWIFIASFKPFKYVFNR